MEASSHNQLSQSGRGKNKRYWKKEEEEALIDALLDLSVDPVWKGEGGFKNGYMVKLERMLNDKFPGCGLKAMPHIDSKVKWFKDKHCVINEMLCKTSEFKWDDEKKIITCEKQAYDNFCKTHSKAAGLWNTPFPFLEKLDIIFCRDRANGVRCELPEESVDMMEKEIVNIGNDEDDDCVVKDTDSVTNDPQVSPPPPCKKLKKEEAQEDKGKKNVPTSIPEVVDLTCMNNMFSDFSGCMKDMNTHLATIASAMSTTQQHEQVMMVREQEVVERKKNLVNDMSIIPGLTRTQVIRATKLLSSNPSDMEVFYSSPTLEWKRDFVFELLGLSDSSS